MLNDHAARGEARDRLVVLASGAGTTLQAVLDAAAAPSFPGQVVAVGLDRFGAPAEARAHAAGIATFVCPIAEFPDRAHWDAALADQLARWRPDLIVLAGFMKLLGPRVLERFPNRIVNTHPALLPAFPGAHAIRDALRYGVRVTGVTVHLVDAGVDTGPILAQAAVDVRDDDTEDTLRERVQAVERPLLVEVLRRVIVDGILLDGRRARFAAAGGGASPAPQPGERENEACESRFTGRW